MSASKSDLIKAVAHEMQWEQNSAAFAVETTLAQIAALATGQKLILRGFGTFEVKTRAARTGRNPQTGLPVEIPASTNLTFKAAKQKA